MKKCDCCRSTPCSESCSFYPEGAEWIRETGTPGPHPTGTVGWQRQEPEPEPPSPPKQSGVHVDVGNYRVVVIDDKDPNILSRATRRTKATMIVQDAGLAATDVIVRGDVLILLSGTIELGPSNDTSAHIPADVLATVLRFAGWKIKRPGE